MNIVRTAKLVMWVMVLSIPMGCSQTPPAPIATNTLEKLPSETSTETLIPTLTETTAPTSTSTTTATITQTPSETPTLTNTPTLLPDFSMAEVAGFGMKGSAEIFLTFDGFDEMLLENSMLLINENVFICEFLETMPERLYCEGPGFPPGTTLDIEVLIDGHLAWEGNHNVPIPTITPTKDPRISGLNACKPGYTKHDVNPFVLRVPGFPKTAKAFCAAPSSPCWLGCPVGDLTSPHGDGVCTCLYPLFFK